MIKFLFFLDIFLFGEVKDSSPRESDNHFELEDAYFWTVEDFNRDGRVTVVVFIQKNQRRNLRRRFSFSRSFLAVFNMEM